MCLYLDNHITGLDFNLNGEIAASIDKYGACLISDVSTGEYRYHLNLEQKFDLGGIINLLETLNIVTTL